MHGHFNIKKCKDHIKHKPSIFLDTNLMIAEHHVFLNNYQLKGERCLQKGRKKNPECTNINIKKRKYLDLTCCYVNIP